MARQRFIWPSLWADPTLGSLSEAHVLLYVACFSLADDHGRLHGDPRYLKGAAWAYRSTSPSKIRRLRDDLAAACSNFCVYAVNGDEYIAFLNWREFQKPKYPSDSKLPAPPEFSGKVPEAFRELSRNVPPRVERSEEKRREEGANPPVDISAKRDARTITSEVASSLGRIGA